MSIFKKKKPKLHSYTINTVSRVRQDFIIVTAMNALGQYKRNVCLRLYAHRAAKNRVGSSEKYFII